MLPHLLKSGKLVIGSATAWIRGINILKGGDSIPSGIITMWSGASNAIPDGWLLCNGSNGTPDLRDKFVLGAGNSYAVGATGGEATHTLTVNEMPNHSHYGIANSGYGGGGNISGMALTASGNTDYGKYYSVNSSTGGSQAHNNIPPYYALCFIMKR